MELQLGTHPRGERGRERGEGWALLSFLCDSLGEAVSSLTCAGASSYSPSEAC